MSAWATHAAASPDTTAYSAAHSRSMSVAEAVRRLKLASAPGAPFRLLCAGADRCEGDTVAAVTATFAPLARWLAAERGVSELAVTLRGPNVRLAPSAAAAFQLPLPAGGSVTLAIQFDPRVLPGPDGPAEPPLAFDLLVAFNAGVWGYETWTGALARAAAGGAGGAAAALPCLVTAYCRSECEADEEALEAAGLELAWEAEANPWASLQAWVPTSERGAGAAAEEGEARAESAWWLCIAPRAA